MAVAAHRFAAIMVMMRFAADGPSLHGGDVTFQDTIDMDHSLPARGHARLAPGFFSRAARAAADDLRGTKRSDRGANVLPRLRGHAGAASMATMRRPGLVLLLSVTAWWSAEGVAWAAREVLELGNSGVPPPPFGKALVQSMFSAWLWIPITLALFWLVRRYPLESGRWPRSLLVLSLAVIAALAFRIAVFTTFNPIVGWYAEMPSLPYMVSIALSYNLFLAWMIVGVAHALLFAQRARQRQQEADRLHADLSQARLQALSAKLNPHFLFNTLNTVAEQVHRNPEAADRMLVGLGALLRRSLEDQGDVTLGDELELLSQYLDIERMRLGDRLHVDWRIAPDTLEARVPHQLLQPLAENAIHHAISRRTTGGRLTIRAQRRDARLQLEIEDDGAPQAVASNNGHGIGLSTTRARLQYQYGDDHALTIDKRDGGTLASIDVPFVLGYGQAR